MILTPAWPGIRHTSPDTTTCHHTPDSQGQSLYLHIILKTISLFSFIIYQVSSCVSNPDFPDMFTVAFVVEKQNGDPSLTPISKESNELPSIGELKGLPNTDSN